MIKIEDFYDFQFNNLFENNYKHSVNELPFVLTKELIDLLKELSHPIAKELLTLNDNSENKKITFVDIDNEKYSSKDSDDVRFKRFTIINSNKAYDNIINWYKINHSEFKIKTPSDVYSSIKNVSLIDNDKKYNYDFLTKNRIPIKIGSFIKKIFGDKFKDGGDPGNDIESFVNTVVAQRKFINDKENNKFNRFELVSGNDIVKWYDGSNYYGGSGDLNNSCMRYNSCGEYIKFYAKNPDVVQMLIMKSEEDENLISGRALVWTLEEPENRIFMDRIYFVNSQDVELFKMYAKKNGWLHKKRQNMNSSEEIYDTVSGDSDNLILKTKNGLVDNDTYPYMDTMAYYNIEDNQLSNDSDDFDNYSNEYYTLHATDGESYDINNGEDESIYVDYYDRSFDEDELRWCEYGGEYRTHEDAVSLGVRYNWDYATEEYINDEMSYSEEEDGYLMYNDCQYSELLEDYILNENVIDVYENVNYDTFDDCLEEEEKQVGSVHQIDGLIEYVYKKGEIVWFNDNNKNYFYECEMEDGISPQKQHKHKIWDKKHIVKKGTNYYYFENEYDKDKFIGQKRFFDPNDQITKDANIGQTILFDNKKYKI